MATAGLLLAMLLAASDTEARRPANEMELRYWLQNMLQHRFTDAEIGEAAGLSAAEIDDALKKLKISRDQRPKRPADAPLLVLPYPGGRHPRIGFLEGAIKPQRETKVSVFTPWDDKSYVVVDVPEAIWSQHGLMYLAHTHVPTMWTKQNVELPKLEWNRQADGTFDIERKLPNGVSFGARVVPGKDAVRMTLWLTNGSKERLTDLRVQNCVMLKGAAGFEQQTNVNKTFSGAYAACRSPDGKRWIISAWMPSNRTWGNDKCPCLHSDPKFRDCAPGETKRLRGWLSFYQGDDIAGEIRRIEASGWLKEEMQVRVRGEVEDAETGKPIPCRIYVQRADGSWFFPRSESPQGSAVQYRKQRPDTKASVEMHTSLSAHPFVIDVPPGEYTLTVERGKEYLPYRQQIAVKEDTSLRIPLRRWINLAELHWYSGDTHVHRTMEELPNLLLAEDLNVAFPLTNWVTEAFVSPKAGGRNSEGAIESRVLPVDATHVIYPRNTEYELFTINKKAHPLGAFFVLNHQTSFDLGAPPVRPIAERARREGGLIEMDKHNWPWSMMLVPIIKPDLYELSNNHMWRTEFSFSRFGEPAAEYMGIQRAVNDFSEQGWIDFTLQNYYALLNCGFRIMPTAGTASGVHPVPLGFGRVYVHLPAGFSYEGWLKGLKEGRSFVTTGPCLFVQLNKAQPGSVLKRDGPDVFELTGRVASAMPLQKIEVIVNGQVLRTLTPANRKRPQGEGYDNPIREKLPIDISSWIAVRCFEDRPDKRPRYAHTSPFHVEIKDRPLRPRKVEVEYLIKRVQDQIERSSALLPPPAQEEYQEALKAYRELLQNAR